MNPIVQVILAFILATAISWVVYPKMVPIFIKRKMHQHISEYALDEFKDKPITPTMGGIVFITITVLVSLVMTGFDLGSQEYLLSLFAFVGYGLIGFIDDYKIIKEGKNEGLRPWSKIFLQLVIAIVFYYFYQAIADTSIRLFPFETIINLGIFYGLFVFLIFVSATNAVNITDGMDGLSGGTSFIALGAFLVFALVEKQTSMAVLIASLMGSLIGYLRVNFKPAKIMMGDCGSLALGGIMAATAMVLKIELLLVVIGGVFVWETGSVVLQILAVKTIKRRIFKYTPIHYSFILSGYREQAIVLMFYVVGLVFAILALIMGLV